MSLFVKWFNIKKHLPNEVKNIQGPYLLLSNHVGFWDPFLIGHLLPRFTHFVSSDAVFRSPILRLFLTGLGTIPKKKGIRDTKVIRDIIGVMRQGEGVGLFPEAVRNWAGKSFPMDPSIVKLIKILKVPVVVAVMKGMHQFNPRWSRKLRRTKVEVSYKILFTPEQVKELSEEELFEALTQAIDHDEVAWQQEHIHPIHSKHKAEEIGHALYVCPECQKLNTFVAKGNDFYCHSCGYYLHINTYGFYEVKSSHQLHFDNIRDWYHWQEKWLINTVSQKFEQDKNIPLLEEQRLNIYRGEGSEEIKLLGEGTAYLYTDRIEICLDEDINPIILPLDQIQSLSAQLHERLEMYYNDTAYRFVGINKGVSALKWEVAVNTLWKKMGQDKKLMAYIPTEILEGEQLLGRE
ncbi:hypothetical protein GCM10023331_08430 [Algivirga pacifica]|uniref:Phospholipid/glycerol acyltransferase domain-containing protein n=1 Tax=Algivirga pacifica TaxID=1162670 RepID=A0ABP9D5T2_9BACT